MYIGAHSACSKHLDKAVRNVMGNRKSMNVKVNKVTGSPQHQCHCGKPADFHVINPQGGRYGSREEATVGEGSSAGGNS